MTYFTQDYLDFFKELAANNDNISFDGSKDGGSLKLFRVLGLGLVCKV